MLLLFRMFFEHVSIATFEIVNLCIVYVCVHKFKRELNDVNGKLNSEFKIR